MIKKIFSMIFSLVIFVPSLCAVTLTWCPPNCTNPPIAGYKIGYGTGLITNWSPQVIQYLNTNNLCGEYTVIFPGSNWLGSYTDFVDTGTNLICVLTNLTVGETYYFAAFWYTADNQMSPPSNEVSYTVPEPITNKVYLGNRLNWWTNMLYVNKSNFNLMTFNNPPPNQFYRIYLILTNQPGVQNAIFVKCKLEWWTNMNNINKTIVDLMSFTNPPVPQFYRSYLIITNNSL